MEILLLVFALPVAVIINSIALQKVLKCPPLVAGITFSIFLIITFVLNNLNILIITLIYTVISYITAVLICIICNRVNERIKTNNCLCNENSTNNNIISNNNHICEETFNCINSNGEPTRINVIPNNINNNCNCNCNFRNAKQRR